MTVRMAIRFVAVAALIALIAARDIHRPAALVLLAVAAVAIAAWARTFRPLRATAAGSSLVVVSVIGGILSVWESASIGLLAAAAIAAGTTFPSGGAYRSRSPARSRSSSLPQRRAGPVRS